MTKEQVNVALAVLFFAATAVVFLVYTRAGLADAQSDLRTRRLFADHPAAGVLSASRITFVRLHAVYVGLYGAALVVAATLGDLDEPGTASLSFVLGFVLSSYMIRALRLWDRLRRAANALPIPIDGDDPEDDNVVALPDEDRESRGC
jgi:hypothetical protein